MSRSRSLLKMRADITDAIAALKLESDKEARLRAVGGLTKWRPCELASLAGLSVDSVWYQYYCQDKPEYAILQFNHLTRPEYVSRMRSDVNKIAVALVASAT